MDSKINRKKRIITDLQRLRDPREAHLTKYDIRQEKPNDLNVIYTEIRGPEDTPYSGGYFVIRFEFTSDYPVSSPSVAFATKIWHPNVDHNSGSVCLNSLNQNWQPTVNIRHILDTHMPWLLKNGNPDDPLNTEAGQQMKSKDPKYKSIVKQWVKKFAYKSQLHSVGSVWYKDKPKKKKKKKKFSIAELTNNSNSNTNMNTNETIKPDIKIASDLPPIITKKRAPSKSVGNMDDFQDWWTQSKQLPNTPSKSATTTPQILRSQSFCLRQETSSWTKTSDLETMNHMETKKEKEKEKYTISNAMDLSYNDNDNDSDLSSMDEDPVYDLGTYQSLNSFEIGLCITNYKWSGSQTPSYLSSNSRHSNNNNNNNNRNHNHNETHTHHHYETYSKSDGFVPQNSFFCPEFSPLCPAKSNSFMNLHDIHDKERILHFAPLTDTQTNAQISEDDNNNDDDDDDDDMIPIPNTKNVGNHNKKIKHKLVDIDIDIDIKDNNKNVVRMSLD